MPERVMRVMPGRLRGRITPPPSKSDAHRAIICSRLAGKNNLPAGLGEIWSDDINTTWRCINRLLSSNSELLDCGESGTTLRLLVPIAAALGSESTFTGHGRLPQRPMQEYCDIFRNHGIVIEMPPELSLPFSLKGKLKSGVFHAPGHISSQYVSGMLLALPLIEGDSELRLTSELQSAPYVDMTVRTMSAHGIEIELLADGWAIRGGQKYKSAEYVVEADYSQAAFWLTAASGGHELQIDGLHPDSVQGDRQIMSLLEDFSKGKSEYVIDVAQIPDLVPILSVAASLVNARTKLVNGARLRLKESDRLASTEDALTKIGADIRQENDGLTIYGGKPLSGGSVDSHNDHRIAMALAIAALFTQNGVDIAGAQAVNKSYPDFFIQFQQLGGVCYELDLG